jgi:16S rRNA (uracil1498-N3)-methyltransferase
MPRFFLSAPITVGDAVTLTGDDAKHISYSLRMAVGEELTLLDGEGGVFRARLSALDGTSVEAEVLEALPAKAESPVRIHLYQAYPKSDKLETIIQKAVELGASAVTPFESERCVKRPKADKVAHVTERHNRIAREAAGQSGRDRLPTVHTPISFDEMIKEASRFPLCLFCYEGEGTLSIKEICTSHPNAREIAVVVGSEGGFSVKESEAARASGLAMTGLGNRILRCETAPLYALSALSFFYEL